jgi:hypothetical protein
MIWNYVNTSGQLVQDLDTEVCRRPIGRANGCRLTSARTNLSCYDYGRRSRRL